MRKERNFVKLHHDLTIQKGNPSVILQGHTEIGRCEVFYLINHDSLESLLATTDDFIKYAVELDYPFKSLLPATEDAVKLDYPSKVVFLIGCSNGLVCLLLGLFCNDTVRESFCLWNPATKEYKELPESPDVDDTYYEIRVSGFCYDSKSSDYNVINCYGRLVQVYSLELNSWKSIDISVPFSPLRPSRSLGSGVFFNGDLHWIHGDEIVVSWILSNERINEIQLPEQYSDYDYNLYLVLAVMEERLCVLESNRPFIVGVEVWVMQDYGVQESWTKSFIINNESKGFMRRVWSSKKGEILIEVDGDQVLYNHKFGTVTKQNNQSLKGITTRGENYFESLVSLSAGTYVQEKKQK